MMQSQVSLTTPVKFDSNSAVSDPSASWPLSEDSESTIDRASYAGSGSGLGTLNFV